jgi:formylglycine-generating enzyme required for sulfatase activity
MTMGTRPGHTERANPAVDTPPAPPDDPPAPNMAWIPGGTFLMGSDDHYPEEAPAHPVTVNGFWIDRHSVTNQQFADHRGDDRDGDGLGGGRAGSESCQVWPVKLVSSG